MFSTYLLKEKKFDWDFLCLLDNFFGTLCEVLKITSPIYVIPFLRPRAGWTDWTQAGKFGIEIRSDHPLLHDQSDWNNWDYKQTSPRWATSFSLHSLVILKTASSRIRSLPLRLRCYLANSQASLSMSAYKEPNNPGSAVSSALKIQEGSAPLSG